MNTESIRVVLSTAQDGRAKDLRYRQKQFRSLHEWMIHHISEVQAAVQDDDQFTEAEARYLTIQTLTKLRDFYDTLDLKAELSSEYRVKHSQDNRTRRGPEEVTYIILERRALFFNAMSVLYACLAAGSCCIVEVSKDSTASTKLLHSAFREALDRTAFVVIDDRPAVDVLSRCLVVDQTGNISSDGARTLMSSDTGASTVAIVDRTANLDQAAQEIMKSKVAFSGTGPYAPRYVLVNEFVETDFLKLLRKYTAKVMSPSVNGSTSKHASLYSQTIPDTSSRKADDIALIESRLFQLTKLADRSDLWDSQRDLGVPSIVLLSTTSHDDAIDAINATRQRNLLALYVFADLTAAKYLTQFVRTRASFINHIPTNILAWPAAPAGYSVSPEYLYTRFMIESPSPQFIQPNGPEMSLENLRQEGLQPWEKQYVTALQPLKPTGQPKEGQGNFFKQGLIVGAVFYLLPAFAVATGGTAAAIRYFWR